MSDQGFDPYAVLGVAPTATRHEIQQAYRRLSRIAHPDLGGEGAAGDMAALNRAWSLLRDEDRRAAHDRTRVRAPGVGPADGAASPDDPGWAAGGIDGEPPGAEPGPPLAEPMSATSVRRIRRLLVAGMALFVLVLLLAVLIGFLQGPGAVR